MKLVRYDAARKALAAATSVDEVKNIRALAEAMKAYGQMAKDSKLIADATKIRMRAERRLGELMAEQAKAIGKAKPPSGKGQRKTDRRVRSKPDGPATLAEAGIDKALAHRARKAAKVPERTFDKQVEAIGEEIISGAARRVQQGNKKERRATREAELATFQRALPDKKFGVILADPEWEFEPWSFETGNDRSPANHYPLSKLEAILARGVGVRKITADDCVLFLWATVPMLPQAMKVVEVWGFRYVSHFVWNKNRIGTGYWSRNKHELLLVGTVGKPPAPAMGDQWDSVLDADVGRHSEKPELFHQLIEAYYPTMPKIELNRRGPPRPGWEAWGNEVEGIAAE